MQQVIRYGGRVVPSSCLLTLCISSRLSHLFVVYATKSLFGRTLGLGVREVEPPRLDVDGEIIILNTCELKYVSETVTAYR